MHTMNLRNRAWATASIVALTTAMSVGPAFAQAVSTAPGVGQPNAPPSTSASNDVEELIVVGTRASQQSANDRKRNAKTQTDSIVADDIGSFPDRNLNEAISRVAGTALGRNDYGEGESVTIRGNGPEQTRVELDGMGVMSTFQLGLGGAVRSADMRELPADLVKSVDIVKGTTADMTEGSLGGSVQIKTRTGLDFTRPYFSMRVGGQMNSLSEKWTPDLNVIASRKFLDDRLGVIVSATYNAIRTDSHTLENNTSGNRGYARIADFDNSPEKTFTFNPNTVGTDQANVAFANSTETPLSLVTKSASAKTKADCYTLFPNNPTGSANQRNQRILEQQTCLTQWNDSTPSLLRQFMNTEEDERLSIDARVDYRLTDNLTIFAKYNKSDRITENYNRTRSLGGIQQNVAGTFIDSTTGYPRIRSVNPARPGYYLWDTMWPTSNTIGGTASTASLGQVLNVVPGSVTVDENHNVTEFTSTNNAVNIDQIDGHNENKTSYLQFGADYVGERLTINFFAARSAAESTRFDQRSNRQYTYGDATFSLNEAGLWETTLPSNYDPNNISNYVQLSPAATNMAVFNGDVWTPARPAYTIAQQPLTTPSFQVTFSPRIGEAEEKNVKFDLAYRTDDFLPFITLIKTGAQYRSQEIRYWGGGGIVLKDGSGIAGTPGYVAPIVLPSANVRGSLRACQPTATSTLSCNFGYVPNVDPRSSRSGVDTVTPEQLLALFQGTIEPRQTTLFGDYPDRGNLDDGWDSIDVSALFAQLGAADYINMDCVKRCTANDGNVYDQPFNKTIEQITNVYLMTEFEQALPFGLVFNGNVGVRGVKRDVEAIGAMQLNLIRTNSSFNPLDPNAATGITTTTFRQNVNMTASTQDWLPSFNLNLWGLDNTVVLRYYGGRTIAQPTVNQLVPQGTCTVDERVVLGYDADGFDSCSGRVGNPALKPYEATNQSISAEWYPNRDTSISLAYHKLNVKTGGGIQTTVTGPLFGSSSQVDPVSGQPLSSLEFVYPTFTNGAGFERTGWEFSLKSAFTFLPWYARYTGVDFNISTLTSGGNTAVRDPITGDGMRPPGESDYYTNLSLWYDDGKLNARVSYQNRTESFDCITPCGGNNDQRNTPGEGYSNTNLPYNPGSPRFNDETTYIDAKVSYNVSKSLQVYLEGRNLNREAAIGSNGSYEPFANGEPRIFRVGYGGRRIMAGIVYKFQ